MPRFKVKVEMAEKNVINKINKNQNGAAKTGQRGKPVPATQIPVPTAHLKGLGGGPEWNPRQAATGVALNDLVRLRKAHPCGSFDWKVNRIGADIGLTCLGCEHRVMLSRAEFEKRFKNYLLRANQASDQPQTEPLEVR